LALNFDSQIAKWEETHYGNKASIGYLYHLSVYCNEHTHIYIIIRIYIYMYLVHISANLAARSVQSLLPFKPVLLPVAPSSARPELHRSCWNMNLIWHDMICDKIIWCATWLFYIILYTCA
jgi:hypothetical protein